LNLAKESNAGVLAASGKDSGGIVGSSLLSSQNEFDSIYNSNLAAETFWRATGGDGNSNISASAVETFSATVVYP